MLLNLNQELEHFVKEVVEVFGNRSGQDALFEMLFSTRAPVDLSFIGNDNISNISTHSPDVQGLAKWDSGMLTTGQHVKHRSSSIVCRVELMIKKKMLIQIKLS